MTKLRTVDESFAGVSGGDCWAERGEAGRWVRVHTHPRTSSFLPWKVPGGPGRKTRLTFERSTRSVILQGRPFRVDDSWDTPTRFILPMTLWAGRAIFLVDRAHTDSWGIDQRHQIIEAANLRESHENFDEEAQSAEIAPGSNEGGLAEIAPLRRLNKVIKSRWIRSSEYGISS